MHFNVKRLLTALNTHRKWLPLALLPPFIYLASATLSERAVTVTQTFSYSGNVLIAKNPVVSIDLNELIASPDLLFQEGFALTDLSRKAELLQKANFATDNTTDLRRLVYKSLNLSKVGDSDLQLAYQGSQEALGRYLVDYYSDRLMTRHKEALQHAKRPIGVAPSLDRGALTIDSRLVFWNPDRLPRAFWVLIVSMLAMMAAIAIREFSDPAFKSERQIARYLGLPILGALPDAEPLTKRLNH
ncbi:hypothetical protein [Thiorhodococcus fuscus]|uniref:Lipopolysaccharide biosynthesis protein n=1 Tax=Thiorhodococcus fuscus TaxID=527200 RepID=A0ABW4Y6U7_9GAMM